MAATEYDWRTARFLHKEFFSNRVRFCWRVFDPSASVCSVFLASFMVLRWTPTVPGALSGTLVFQLKPRLLQNGTVLCSPVVFKALFYTTLAWELSESTRNRLKTARLATYEELHRHGAVDMRREAFVPPILRAPPANPDVEGPLEATHTLVMREGTCKRARLLVDRDADAPFDTAMTLGARSCPAARTRTQKSALREATDAHYV